MKLVQFVRLGNETDMTNTPHHVLGKVKSRCVFIKL